MQRSINLYYCKSLQKNNNLKVYLEKPTKSNLFIRTSNHAANASPPNQKKLIELTFIIFSINVAIQANFVSTDQYVILKQLLQLVLPTFV